MSFLSSLLSFVVLFYLESLGVFGRIRANSQSGTSQRVHNVPPPHPLLPPLKHHRPDLRTGPRVGVVVDRARGRDCLRLSPDLSAAEEVMVSGEWESGVYGYGIRECHREEREGVKRVS